MTFVNCCLPTYRQDSSNTYFQIYPVVYRFVTAIKVHLQLVGQMQWYTELYQLLLVSQRCTFQHYTCK